MPTTVDTLALALVWICAAVLVWCVVLAVAAWAGGWLRLAREYGATDAADGALRGLSARFGVASYSGVLSLRADALGLSLGVLAIFRPFHRPLFVPWSAMRITERRGPFGRGLHVTFPSASRVSITFFGRAAEIIRPFVDEAAEARGECRG